MKEDCDAVVIGGGPAGATAALLLARAGWDVALVEQKAFPRHKVCGEYLSATNLPLFDRLGIGARFRSLAGPPVDKVGLFAGMTVAQANLPRAPGKSAEWGRALSREHLDTWLLDEARSHGAKIWQPCSVLDLQKCGDTFACEIQSGSTQETATLRAPIVIAAHGSWQRGRLPTMPRPQTAQPGDLFAFKAKFLHSDLPRGMMPLLAFPGGYGGMVHCEEEMVSLSCCVRRDVLARLRRQYPGDAGDAVLAYLSASCLGVRMVLASARRVGGWLAAGPILPGIRVDSRGGLFRVGNAAGEAHPVIAEGISMALQSSGLLAQSLIAWRKNGGNTAKLPDVHSEYAASWRQSFAPRLWASSAIAQWAMSSTAVSMSLPILWCFPKLLTWGAQLSGKADIVIR